MRKTPDEKSTSVEKQKFFKVFLYLSFHLSYIIIEKENKRHNKQKKYESEKAFLSHLSSRTSTLINSK
jgi:hypothetical protein